jgi:molybdate transport system substrate-binding protein
MGGVEMIMTRFFASVLFVLTIGVATAAHSEDKTITIFAAASMKNALDDVNLTFTTRTFIKVVTHYGASSVLIKQIEGGAPADVFLSANSQWMDYGVEKKS